MENDKFNTNFTIESLQNDVKRNVIGNTLTR